MITTFSSDRRGSVANTQKKQFQPDENVKEIEK